MNKLKKILMTLVLMSSMGLGFQGTLAADNAVSFVTHVSLETTSGPVTSNKINDGSSLSVRYDLDIGDGSSVLVGQPYTMDLPPELSYETNVPIDLNTGPLETGGIKLGEVTITNNVISIVFNSNVSDLNNVKINFGFWSKLNKSLLNYETGNDLNFPNRR